VPSERCKNCSRRITRDDCLCNNCGSHTTDLNSFDTAVAMRESFVQLNNKVNEIRSYNNSNNVPYHDQRNQVLGSFSFIIAWAMLQLDFYNQFGRTSNSAIPQWIMNMNPGIDRVRIEEFLSNYDNMNRRSFLTNFLFQVEVLLEEINKILTNPTQDQGYKFLVKHVVRELEMNNPNNETYRILYFPAMVRNAMHMNGVHTENEDNGRIDDILFKFQENQLINYGSWRHTYFFCDKILDVINDMLRLDFFNDKSMPVPHPIQQTY